MLRAMTKMLLVLVGVSLGGCAQKTYDLLRYGHVNIIKTVSKDEGRGCKEKGFMYECLPLFNASDKFKNDIWRYKASWKAFFNEHTKEVKIDVNFHRTYVVNNLLLSFKEANNISALSVEVKSNSNVVHIVQYAISDLVCDFFFSDDSSTSGCSIKEDLSDGVIYHYKPPVKGDQIIIRLFPPIVNDYEKLHFYSINHLFIGGSCYCRNGGQSTQCHVSLEDDTIKNDGTRYVLLCDVDKRQLIQHRYSQRKRRRRREVCTCSAIGTLYSLCKPFIGITQQCPCKSNFNGISCDRCAVGYFGYPRCTSCNCDYVGSISSTCNITSGQCKCEPRYSGLRCDKCAPGRFDFPFCYPCQCARDRTLNSMCHPVSGRCVCSERYQGEKCTMCKKPYKNYPVCHRPGCRCSRGGAVDGTCDKQGNCKCKEHYTGKTCDMCMPGFGSYPSCTPCRCDHYGSTSDRCDPRSGQCDCKTNFVGTRCNECIRSDMIYPHCNLRCRCNDAGTRHPLKSDSTCVPGQTCVCKRNVVGKYCSQCKLNSYNLSALNPDGCTNCQCSETGSFGNLATCDAETGQCVCKPNVIGKRCNQCDKGFYGMDRFNLFGCLPCNCDIGGSVSPNCDVQGSCKCKPNFEGKTCNKLRVGPYYVPDYYHLKFEVEESTIGGQPVSYRYYDKEFKQFTGRGYFAFGQKQSTVKLLLDVPKTRKYRLLARYYLKQEEEITMLVNLQSKDKETSYAAVVDFERFDVMLSTASYASVLRSDGEKEFLLTEGEWEMEMSSISPSLLVDHIVLIPEEYYTGRQLQPDDVTACVAGQPKGSICMMYKYVSLQKFQLLQAERGSDSKGYGNDVVRKTNVFKDADLLPQLITLHDMAELSREQIALTLEVSVHTTDTYFLVLSYVNPDKRTYRLDMYDGDSGKRGQIEVVPCLYQFLCRLVVHHMDGTPLPFKYSHNKTSEITFLGNIRGSLAIDYVALIPVSQWSPDYIIPNKLCYKKDKVCLQNIEFQTPHDAVDVAPTDANPVSSLTNTVHAIAENTVVFVARPLVKPGIYALVYQFYQPSTPRFNIDVNLSVKGEIIITQVVQVLHCAANSGCRQVLLELNAVTGIFESPVTVTIQVPKGKELWIDSMFLIPSSSFDSDVLLPKRVELTQHFQRACVDQNGLPLLSPPGDFCMHALVTLTSKFTNKTFECNCNAQGSTSVKCDRIGGQCKCKAGVVGRDCSKCKTGDYHFPSCKTCNCFKPGSISADCNKYGHCTCKPNYTGWRCDRCEKKQWGFPLCRPCDCEARGSFSLTCRESDGQCPCLKNFNGKKCNQCQVGFYDFPECRSCNCNPAGILITPNSPTGCYKFDRNRCDCKLNVEGNECDICKSYFYGLNVSNPLGCSRCNCSSFGTVRGAGPCNSETGQCQCHPNVAGKDCNTCKDGFYIVRTGYLFSCQPCLCSVGGSLHKVCDKQTGQCKCKDHVTGIKCDEIASAYYLPPIDQYSFEGRKISPSSPKGTVDRLDGTYVNSSYASRRMSFTVGEIQSYYLLISYALVKKKNALIDIEFTNDVSFTYLTHKLKTKRLGTAVGEIVKESNSYLVLNFTRGLWHMQTLFQETIFLNKITLVPAKYFSPYSISRTIQNPCYITDARRYCVMYAYYDLPSAKAIIYEAESLTRDARYFDLNKYTSADINGAILLRTNEYLFTSKNIESHQNYFIIIQYLNTESVPLTLEVVLRFHSNMTSQRGQVELFPCAYAFACRQVALNTDGTKMRYDQGGGLTYMTFKVLTGKAVYIDYIALVPASKWTSHMLTPTFFCIRRFSRCMLRSFPTTSNMFKLETKAARGVSLLNSAPPNSVSHSTSVLLTRYQRTLRWMSPMKTGGYYIIIHYYQPLMETFYSKVILATYQRADAGKVLFKYCPSVYGCRSVVSYLDEDLEQRFAISGNIVRAIFTIPFHVKFWVESLIFVNPVEYNDRKNILDINPIDQTRRYLKKCAGKKFGQLGKNTNFCRSSTFELTLGLGLNPKPCKCHPQGTTENVKCNPYDGHCSCRSGFLGQDCSSCIEGLFPECKPRSIIT